MRTRLGAFALALVSTACRDRAPAPAEASADVAVADARYLALGDSFTIGTGSTPERAFPARLVERWRASGCAVALENVAVNGYATDDVIADELPALARFRPTFVTIAIGANDIVRGGTLDAYRANVRKILDAARASGARVVAIPQPDWSRSPTAAAFGSAAELGAKIRAFDAALAEEAASRGASFVDLAPLMLRQADAKMLAGDGLHPSADAYDAWAAELAKSVTPPCR